MSSFADRVVGALKADVRIFEEIEADKEALVPALGVVAATAVASGIGALGEGGVIGLVVGIVAALIGWVISSALIYFVGVHVMPEPTTKADVPEVMRVLGFAAAPGLLRVFTIIPFLGILISLAILVWQIYVSVVAVRQVLDYRSTGRAVAVCVVAWLVGFAISCGIMAMAVGCAAVLGGLAGAAA